MGRSPEPTYDVFIGCVRAEDACARAVHDMLTAQGRRCVIAWTDLDPIARPRAGDAACVILLISARSRDETALGHDAASAADSERDVFIARLEDAEPGDGLVRHLAITTRVDVFSGDVERRLNALAVRVGHAVDLAAALRHEALMAERRAQRMAPQWRWRSRAIRFLIYVTLAFLITHWDPLGVGGRASLPSQDIFQNVVATSYGDPPMRTWPEEAQEIEPDPVAWNEHITVLQLDDSGLPRLGGAWPISMKHHAKLLSTLYEKFHPDAIMIDVLFLDQRDVDSDGLNDLLVLFEKIRKEDKTTVFLASLGDGRVLKPLAEATIPVTVNWSISSDAGQSPFYYPMLDCCRRGGAPPRDGPALVIYGHLCHAASVDRRILMKCPLKDEWLQRDFETPMSVFWGVNPPGLNWEEGNLGIRCSSQPQSWLWRLHDMIWNKGFGAHTEVRQTCPYAQIIKARDFADEEFREQAEVEAAFGRALGPASPNGPPKIVFYGVDFDAAHDRMETPTHGSQPGVYLHAMALDNLLTYGKGYIKVYGKEDARIVALNLLLMALITATVILGKEARTAAADPPRDGNRLHRIFAVLHRTTYGPRLLEGLCLLAVFLIILIVTLVAFQFMRLAPVNWLGFFGLTVIIDLADEPNYDAMVQYLMAWFAPLARNLGSNASDG